MKPILLVPLLVGASLLSAALRVTIWVFAQLGHRASQAKRSSHPLPEDVN